MLNRHFSSTAVALLLATTLTAGTEETASVNLPLADYLELVERIAALDREEQERTETAEPSVAEVVEQFSRVVIGDDDATVRTTFEVEIRGDHLEPVALPVTGAASTATVEPAASAGLWRGREGLSLTATEPGRYTVELESSAGLTAGVGVQQLELARVTAAVSTTEVELPSDLGWSCQGAVVAGDVVDGDRRTLRLALNRHRSHTFEVRREVRGGAAEEVLAKTVVVTLLAIHGSDVERHDIVLYEVARGALAELEVAVPAGLTLTRLASDEGDLPAVVDDGRVLAQRRALLTGTGYLVLSSRPEDPTRVGLEPMEPTIPVRSRYLTTSTTVAATVVPEPAANWLRVDLTDLPAEVHAAAERLELGAAWRLTGEPALTAVALTRSPPAELLTTLVEERDSTTLLTVDGTLLHRDRLTVTTAASGLTFDLPAGATLWSSQVDGVAVRPVDRDGATVVPLPFGARRTSSVEVVVVQHQGVLPGRSRIELELPGLRDPVLAHHWRLLLPEDHRYRYAKSPLHPAPARHWRAEVWQPESRGSTASARVLTSSGGDSNIRGTVADNQDIPLPGVTLSVFSRALAGGSQAAISDARGSFAFRRLPAGHYRLEGDLPGFSPVALELDLASRQTVRADLNLHPQQFSDVIEVMAEVPVVDSTQTNSSVTFGTDAPRRRSSGHRSAPERQPAPAPLVHQAARDLDELSQGLVGGVRPVPVAIPERGKAFDLEGALPPDRVTLQIEIKAGKG